MAFLGIDIGSSFTKLTVIDASGLPVLQKVLRTFNRDKNLLAQTLKEIYSVHAIHSCCATGYGRDHLKEAHISKTEIYCAAKGISALAGKECTIIDVGGEDIKVIRTAADGKVIDFYMNSKCAAGTGTFLTEIAKRAEIDLSRMSELAAKSTSNTELNSFCTVFAKTEIMKWIFDEMPVEDMSRGIYLSIVNRIAKLRMDTDLPVYLIGGVIAFHPYLKTVLEEKMERTICVPEQPQMINSYGAALLAKKHMERNNTAA
jgi:(R)-2-hydroxyacyl-CoA dehydratese activating ATPase